MGEKGERGGGRGQGCLCVLVEGIREGGGNIKRGYVSVRSGGRGLWIKQ